MKRLRYDYVLVSVASLFISVIVLCYAVVVFSNNVRLNIYVY